MTEGPAPSIRVDKWLWQARFFKTRSLAAKVVSTGRVRVNSTPISKPSRSVGAGDVLTFPQAREVRVIKIVALGERRGPAPEAQTLYEDLAPPEPRERVGEAGMGPVAQDRPKDRPKDRTRDRERGQPGRPTKRDRRAIDRLEGNVFKD
ncbi:MAG: RNA-binding S4 domain-containing protein [Pseudomonadota bacterium]